MRKYLPVIPIAVAFVFSAAVYGKLPERVPVHWDWTGQPDRWGSRLEGAFLMPAMTLGLWLLLRFLPKIDPRRANYARFGDTYDFVVAAIVTFMAGLHVVVLGAALGWPIAVDRVVPGAVGVLLVIIGNLLPRARSNWWFGIRTPWTLSSDRVWQKTHRVGGYLMILAGAGLILHAIVARRWTIWLSGSLVALSVFGTMVYSYLKWRDERHA
jgi:uncharacterized membrane protein